MDMIRIIHGELRWIIVVVAVVVIVKYLMGWLGKRDYTSFDRGLLVGYTSLMDVNLLLGLILLFSFGISGMHRIEHAVTMILAVVAAHMTAIWRRSTDTPKKFHNQLLMVLLSLILVLAGVIRLRGFLYQGGFF
jgi:FtsH-binding integral membrane protein